MEGKKGFVLGALVGALIVLAFFILQQGSSFQQITQPQQPAQPPALQKIKVSFPTATLEIYFLPIEAGNDRGIWAKYGLDPEFVVGDPVNRVRSIKEHIASGIKIGVNVVGSTLTARSEGAPVKVVAGFFDPSRTVRLYVKPDGPMQDVKDLDGRKFGVASTTEHWTYRAALALSHRHAINPELIDMRTFDLAAHVAALKVGRIDAFLHSENAALRLVETGELRILLAGNDIYPQPFVGGGIWVTEDLIQENPDLVKRFVKAWLEAVKLIHEDPSYAADVYVKKSNAPKDLAAKVVAELIWYPDGMKAKLPTAVKVNWQFSKDSGTIPPNANLDIEQAVNVSFLP